MNPSKIPRKVVILGSGPCRIGQGREFDLFGYQILSVLKAKGIQTIAVCDDPTSILSDRILASRVYIEPLTMDVIEKILATEKPDGLLQILGDQSTLNLSIFCDRDGVFDRYGIRVFGNPPASLMRTEDRELLRASLKSIPVQVPEGRLVATVEESLRAARDIAYPIILKPLFALKGIGGFVSYNMEETKDFASTAFSFSPVGEIMVEKAYLGWTEITFQVLRDATGNSVALAAFEDLDPLGIHTGDSLSVYPIQTIPRKIIESLKGHAQDITEALGLCGCIGVQYGVNPDSQESIVIDVSPGLTRETALVSHTTGLRLGEIATRLALGERLDDLFEPAHRSKLEGLEAVGNLVALKRPWFPVEMLFEPAQVLGASMKSISSSLHFGRTFPEAFNKAFSSFRAPETSSLQKVNLREAIHHITNPTPMRILYVYKALRQGIEIEEIYELSRIDPFYLEQLNRVIAYESKIRKNLKQSIDQGNEKRISSAFSQAKQQGFSDRDLAALLEMSADAVSRVRHQAHCLPQPESLDVIAGDTQPTSRIWLSYGKNQRVSPKKSKGENRVLILGSGTPVASPNAELDDACAAVLRAVREEGHESILVDNCPQALRSFQGLYDRAYVERVDEETLRHILSIEEPSGVMTQFGGESALSLSSYIESAGFRVLGTPVSSIQTVRDLDLCTRFLDKLGLASPLTKLVTNAEEIVVKSRTMGFPLIASGTLEGETKHAGILYDEQSLTHFMGSGIMVCPTRPLILQKLSENAIRFEVNALSDGTDVFVSPIIEHIEGAAVNPIDSSSVLPSLTTDAHLTERIRSQTTRMVEELKIAGLLNVHYFLREGELGVLEVHPRASHTLAFASRSLGLPLADLAAKLLLGRKLKELGLDGEIEPSSIAVKEAVLPFDRFPGVDPVLGPQPKSTGQVMGIGETFGAAFAKSQISIGLPLPPGGKVFVSVRNRDKRSITLIAAKLLDLGFTLIATEGTARILNRHGLTVEGVYKIAEGRPNIVDLIKNGEIQLIINTPRGERPRRDLMEIRAQAVANRVPCITTISGASAAVFGIRELKGASLQPKSLEAYYGTGSGSMTPGL
jgi:carbamoyl-phosphate synthase large subunit